MLARNFMTPIELDIPAEQQAALVTVLLMLERGDIQHKAMPRFGFWPDPTEQPPETFNMAQWHCGSACCIGGWAEQIGAVKFGEPADGSGLDRLFYPDSYEDTGLDNRGLRHITTAQAAAALRSYLATGEPNWSAALLAE